MQYFNNDEKEMLKEQFISQYCNEKGWNRSTLTTEQLLEIMSNPHYKNPGMIKS